MAIYILIKKSVETSTFVDYDLELTDGSLGKVRIDKESGEVTVVEVFLHEKEGLFERAVYKLRQHLEKGDFPEVTCWAS